MATDAYARAARLNHTLTTTPTSVAVRRAVGDARNWLLLAAVVLSAVAAVSLLIARGMGARWTGWLSIVLLASVACDARVRAVIARAWSEVCLLGGDRTVLPWRAALLLIALPNLLFLLCHAPGIQTGDSRPVVMTASSLLTEGDAELSEFAEFYRRNRYVPEGQDLPYFLVRCPAGVFSQYPSGMMPFALPVVAAARLWHSDFTAPIVDQHLEQLTAALVAAACTTLFFLLAWQLASPATALCATILLGAGSVMYSTIGQALWQHGGVILWTEVALLIEFRTWRQSSWRATAGQGLAMAMMLACRLSAAVIVVSFGVWVLVRSPSRAVKIASIAAVAWLPWLVFHWSLYHSLTGPMTVQTNSFFWSFGKAHSWAGILFSPTHGLFVYQPWLLLAVAGLWPACKRWWRDDARADAIDSTSRAEREAMSGPPGWRLWAVSAIALHLTVVSGWWCWWGGLCWGPRLASEAIPLAALLCLEPMGALLQSRAGRWAICATAVVSALLHVPSVWLHQDRWYDGMQAAAQEANAWRWHSPPFLYPFTELPRIEE